MGELEDAVQRVREAGLEDEADVLERLSGSTLRQKAQKAEALEAENERLKAENRRLVVAPKKEQALRAAGVDFDSLRPAERQVIAALDLEGEEPAEEWVAKTIADLQLPIVGGQGGTTEGLPPAAAVVRTATQAPGSGPGSTGGPITPETVAQWSTEQQLRWKQKNPDAWEALKRGEEVAGATIS